MSSTIHQMFQKMMNVWNELNVAKISTGWYESHTVTSLWWTHSGAGEPLGPPAPSSLRTHERNIIEHSHFSCLHCPVDESHPQGVARHVFKGRAGVWTGKDGPFERLTLSVFLKELLVPEKKKSHPHDVFSPFLCFLNSFLLCLEPYGLDYNCDYVTCKVIPCKFDGLRLPKSNLGKNPWSILSCRQEIHKRCSLNLNVVSFVIPRRTRLYVLTWHLWVRVKEQYLSVMTGMDSWHLALFIIHSKFF